MKKQVLANKDASLFLCFVVVVVVVVIVVVVIAVIVDVVVLGCHSNYCPFLVILLK